MIPATLVKIICVLSLASMAVSQEWRFYGGDAGGTRYSSLQQINPRNVGRLKQAWTYHTGEVTRGDRSTERHRIAPFESTPLVIDGVLYLTTPSSRVIALDAETGKEIWQFDPQAGLPGPRRFHQNRGVAYWQDKTGNDRRILYGTFDARLITLDARTGKPCRDFGKDGVVDLREGLTDFTPETEYGVTSPPVVYRDLVITGAEVPEYPSKGPSGMVRAFNIRSGKLVWTFHTIPQPGETGHETWQSDSWKGRTGANVWSVMSVDAERGLVFLPIGSASYDFYAPTVKVRTCSPIVWSRWTRPPANWFGTSRPCTTISGITICRRSPCSSMWGGMAAKFPRWLRSRRWVSYLFSTGLRESHCFR